MHQLYFSEVVVGRRAADMDAKTFCFVKWPDEWTDQSKITTKRYQICKQASLLCCYEGAIERCRSSNALYKKLSPWTEKIIPRVRVSDAAIVLATAGVGILKKKKLSLIWREENLHAWTKQCRNSDENAHFFFLSSKSFYLFFLLLLLLFFFFL